MGANCDYEPFFFIYGNGLLSKNHGARSVETVCRHRRTYRSGQFVIDQTPNQPWEEEYATTTEWPESRPLNLDPGYVTDAKLVLASTKNHAHRIYLDSGIYAEVTLYYQGRQWKHWNWTYPDYRRSDYYEFFTSCREYYLDHSRR